MKLRTLFLLFVLVAVCVFAVLNWRAFTSPTTLSLGVAVIQAPLGLIMLGLLALVTAVFLVFVLYLQASVLLEARHHARELQDNRKLADQAEASRFTELRRFLELELKKLADMDTESATVVQERIERLDHDLRAAIEESGNTLAAYFGELEDRMERETEGGTGTRASERGDPGILKS